MKYKTIYLILILITCVFTNSYGQEIRGTKHIQSPDKIEQVEANGVKAFLFDYKDLCTVTYIINSTDEPETAGHLIINPYRHMVNVGKLKPVNETGNDTAKVYTHDMLVEKEGKTYTLRFFTFVNADFSNKHQRMVLLDDKWNDVSPSTFGLDGYLKGKEKQFEVPKETQEKLLETTKLQA